MTSDPNQPLLVVGLGNPGAKYEQTRHNIGFLVLDELAARTLPTPSRFTAHKRSQATITETRWQLPVTAQGAETGLAGAPAGMAGVASRKVILAKPQTFMNLSGKSVAALAKFFSVPLENTIVIHDELDIDPGAIRLKRGGGENGHNGLRSISQSLGSKDYLRVRVGIGRPPGRQDPADFVLNQWNTTERKDLPFTISDAADATELLAAHGLELAQNRVHSR